MIRKGERCFFSACWIWLTWTLLMAPSSASSDPLHPIIGATICDPTVPDSWNVEGAPPSLIYRSVSFAVKCYDAIPLNHTLAVQHVSAMAAYFKEYYVFADICKDPAASPQNNSMGLSVYSGKLDLVGGLNALAHSIRLTPGYASLGHVVFSSNSLLNRLRDAHVTLTGGGEAYGSVLKGHRLALLSFPAGPDAGGGRAKQRVALALTMSANGRVIVSQLNQTGNGRPVRIQSIDGREPMDWIISVAKSSFLSLSYKALGARVNKLLRYLSASGFGSIVGALGDLAQMQGKQYKVKYTGGAPDAKWRWAVGLPASWANASLNSLGQKASRPGIPYRALQDALGLYNNATTLRQLLRSELLSWPTLLGPDDANDSFMLAGSLVVASNQNSSNVTNIIYDSKGQPVGTYGLWEEPEGVGGQYAVWKLAGFSIKLPEYATHWGRLLAMAEGAGVDRLMIDLTSNGGGTVSTGYWAAAALYPELLAPNNTHPWLGAYDRRVGPLARYLEDEGLLATGVVSELAALSSNATWLSQRTAQLNANSTGLAELNAMTGGLLAAIDVLVSSTSEDGTCGGPDPDFSGDCSAYWSSFYPAVLDGYNFTNTSSLTTAQLFYVFDKATAALLAAAPYTEKEDISDVGASEVPLYGKGTGSRNIRGGISGEYTRRYFLNTLRDFVINGTSSGTFSARKPPVPSSSPFKQILAVGNGLCGSTCDTFSRTAWMYSKSNPAAPSFRYVTFGGTGKAKDIGGTSFPGGNVLANREYLSQSWAYYGLLYATARWSGEQHYIDAAAAVGAALPAIPSLLMTTLPSFTQSEVYQRPLGPAALPMEYYMVPTDHYVGCWFTNATVLNGSDLPELYERAYQWFN